MTRAPKTNCNLASFWSAMCCKTKTKLGERERVSKEQRTSAVKSRMCGSHTSLCEGGTRVAGFRSRLKPSSLGTTRARVLAIDEGASAQVLEQDMRIECARSVHEASSIYGPGPGTSRAPAAATPKGWGEVLAQDLRITNREVALFLHC